MHKKFNKTLWSNRERDRHFIIPDDVKPPAGDFVLRTVIGRQMDVAEDGVTDYEVTREEAKDWLKGQFGEMLGTAKSAILSSVAKFREATAKDASRNQSQPPFSTPDRGKRKEGFRDNFGSPSPQEPASSTGGKNEQIKEQIGDIFSELAAVLIDSLKAKGKGSGVASPPPTGQTLEHQIRDVGERVRREANNIPDRLRELFESRSTGQDSSKLAQLLETLANEIEKSAALAGNRLREIAKTLRDQKSSSEK